jgi:TPR repeat protein
MYAEGRGVPQNYPEAMKWYRLAADQGYAEAQVNLGITYYNGGQGIPRDYAEAARWFDLAADQGNAYAQNNLGLMYAQGQGVRQDIVRADVWFNLSAMQGHQDAVRNREIAERRMTPAQIADAQKLARDWKPKR